MDTRIHKSPKVVFTDRGVLTYEFDFSRGRYLKCIHSACRGEGGSRKTKILLVHYVYDPLGTHTATDCNAECSEQHGVIFLKTTAT